MSLLVTLVSESHRRNLEISLPLCMAAVMQRVRHVGSEGSRYYDLSLLASALRFMLQLFAAQEWSPENKDLEDACAMMVTCANSFGGGDRGLVPSFVQKGVCRLAMQCATLLTAGIAARKPESVRVNPLDLVSPPHPLISSTHIALQLHRVCRFPSSTMLYPSSFRAWCLHHGLSCGMNPHLPSLILQGEAPCCHWMWHGSLGWLPWMCGDRDEVIRASAFKIVTDTTRTSEGSLLLQTVSFRAADEQNLTFMEAIFSSLLDGEECFAVRTGIAVRSDAGPSPTPQKQADRLTGVLRPLPSPLPPGSVCRS